MCIRDSKYTGLRPGEKLYEELLSNKENTKETPHEKIRVAAVREYAYKDVVEHIDLLAELSLHVHILPMVREMKSFVPEFKSQNSQDVYKRQLDLYGLFRGKESGLLSYDIPLSIISVRQGLCRLRATEADRHVSGHRHQHVTVTVIYIIRTLGGRDIHIHF